MLLGAASTASVHADGVNSRLAEGLRKDLDQTLVRFGGLSIVFTDRMRTGVAVLRETKGADAAFNKTEICPFGNNCPPEVVKELKGLRRCSLCQYAVRTIDHLPAVVAKKRQASEQVDEMEILLTQDAGTLNSAYTLDELEELEGDRVRLCEDLTGWILNEEVLESKRQQLAVAPERNSRWLVRRPEVLEQALQRVQVPVSATEYLLTRLGDTIAYPSLDSPQIRARLDLLRRELLARAGNLTAAFARETPVNPAAECAGVIRSLIDFTGVSIEQIAKMLEDGSHLSALPKSKFMILEADEVL